MPVAFWVVGVAGECWHWSSIPTPAPRCLNHLVHAQVDAFTSKAFGGNSAAIIFLEGEARSISTETLQVLAMENNLSETAYIQTIDPSESVASASNFGLRWFTPTIEVKLCGHATLASAAAIWKCEMLLLLERVGGETRICCWMLGAWGIIRLVALYALSSV